MRIWPKLTLLSCVLVFPALGQEPPQRPTIGLALSGGGARGFAHIGVLEWLEAHHIPVDYIAGTSMGGLMGGMYAGGWSPTEMRAFIAEIQWSQMLRDTPDYGDLGFRRKEDLNDYPNPLELGVNGGVNLPQGLIDGQKIGLLLSRLTLPFASLESFDDLPIPFRCVAVDMVTGKEEVFSKGSLATALRATMAIPGVFSPVEVGEKVLADGGLLNNVPTDVVKAMGADIIIAVDIGTPLGDRESLNSLVGAVNQAFSVMILENVRDHLRLADVLISPPLDGFSAFDFQAAKSIVDRGVQGAAAKALILQNLALDDQAWAAYLARRGQRAAPFESDSVTADTLTIQGAKAVSPSVFHDRLDGHLGHPLDVPQLDADLTRIYADGYYSRLGYEAIERGDHTTLRVDVKEKQHGPPFLHFHFDFQGGTEDETKFSFRTRALGRGWSGYGSEWRTDLTLGRTSELAADYYQPFGRSPFWVAPRVWYGTTRTDLFAVDRRVAEYRTSQVGASFDAGFNLDTWGQLSGGIGYGHVDQDTIIGLALRPNVDEEFGYLRSRFKVDTRDHPVLPRHGLRLDSELRVYTGQLGSGSEFSRLSGQFQWFQPLGRRQTLFALANGGTTFGASPPPYGEFTLGGLMRLNAYQRDRFRGANALHGAVGMMQEVADLPLFFGRKVYASGMVEMGGTFDDFNQARYFTSVSAGVMADTILGPTYFGYSFGEEGENRLHFSIGRLF